MPNEQSETPRFRHFRIRDLVPILNSMFRTANIDVTITELTFLKEEVVIGFPQVESLENELKVVDRAEDFEPGGRYLLLATISSSGREVPIYVRVYLTSDGKLITEDHGDNGATLVDPEETTKPELWERVLRVIENVVPWGPIIAKIILSLLGVTTNNPK